MQTKNGHSVGSLLNVAVADGLLSLTIPVASDVKDFSWDSDGCEPMIQHITTCVELDKKPAATYSKVLDQIDDTREYLADLYSKLFETYQRAVDVTPKTRMSPKDKAMVDMLGTMPDKMLRDFTALQLGDKANDYILPSERGFLIAAYVAVGKNKV